MREDKGTGVGWDGMALTVTATAVTAATVTGKGVRWDRIDGDGRSGDGGSLKGDGRDGDKEVRDGDGHGGGPGTAAPGMGTAEKWMAVAGTGVGQDGETPQGRSNNGKARQLRPGRRDESRTSPGRRGGSGRSSDSATSSECRLGGTAAAGGRSNDTIGRRPGGTTAAGRRLADITAFGGWPRGGSSAEGCVSSGWSPGRRDGGARSARQCNGLGANKVNSSAEY